MTLLTLTISSLLFSALTTAIALPQGPNNFAFYNPNIRTDSYNATYFLLAIPTTTVQSFVPYPLLPVPIDDKSLFPSGFPATAHPVVVNSGYMNDIRMLDLQIPALLGAAISVPYVDRLQDGSNTPFSYPVRNWIGGEGSNNAGGVVPATVGTIEGTPIIVSQFVPTDAAYLGITADESIAQVKPIIAPNPVSGPGVVIEAVDFDFFTDSSPAYTAHTFHTLVNQAEILTTITTLGMCQRNTYYFNQTFTEGIFRKGGVKLYPNAVPTGLVGNYTDVSGYSASAGMVGYNAQDCKSAAAQVDPTASQ